MNKAIKIILKNTGVTLVEMMVVVAILGVLATIAVPNMNLMTERARRQESKAAVAALYASEKAFYSEFSYYTYCLYEIGYVPDLSVRYYLTGFYNGRGCAGSGLQCTWDSLVPPTGCNMSTGVTWSGAHRNDATFEMNRWANPALIGAGLPGNYDVYMPNAFKAVAFGSISMTNPLMDVWSIDQDDNILNEQNGL